MNKKIKKMTIKIPVISGTYKDLSVFDFSFKNIVIVNIKDSFVDDYIKKLEPNMYDANITFINKIRSEINFDHEQKFLILFIDIKNFNYEDALNCWKLLLIIFPSNLQIEHIIYYDNNMGFFQSSLMESFDTQLTGNDSEKLLNYRGEDIGLINEFISLVFNRLKAKNYIGVAIENYIQSYKASHYHYQFLTLLFALESVVEQESELSYRLKRFISVLCGEKPFNCNIIFENINEMYRIRSKIVHGGNMKDIYKDLIKNTELLQFLVSRTIIELLIHNISDIKMLNKALTALGYGEKRKLSNNYKDFEFNIIVYENVNWISIKERNSNDLFDNWLSSIG
ncbi:hypothetical protein GCM10027592_29610 [Spirosoma flavus]